MLNTSLSQRKQAFQLGLFSWVTVIYGLLFIQPAQSFIITFEAPNTQSTTKSGAFTIDFNDSGSDEIDTTGGDTVTNSSVTYTYSDVDTNNKYNLLVADQYGGAGATGKYIVNSPNADSRFTISISQDQQYFGFWWSAGDDNNTIELFNDGVSVLTFNANDIRDRLPDDLTSTISSIDGSATYNTGNYYGNPNNRSQNPDEPYAFINFYAETGEAFDRVDLYQTDTGGLFESDNHTFLATAPSIDPGVEVRVPWEFSSSLGLLLFGAMLLSFKFFRRLKN